MNDLDLAFGAHLPDTGDLADSEKADVDVTAAENDQSGWIEQVRAVLSGEMTEDELADSRARLINELKAEGEGIEEPVKEEGGDTEPELETQQEMTLPALDGKKPRVVVKLNQTIRWRGYKLKVTRIVEDFFRAELVEVTKKEPGTISVGQLLPVGGVFFQVIEFERTALSFRGHSFTPPVRKEMEKVYRAHPELAAL